LVEVQFKNFGGARLLTSRFESLDCGDMLASAKLGEAGSPLSHLHFVSARSRRSF
jgi:hypothetical protein